MSFSVDSVNPSGSLVDSFRSANKTVEDGQSFGLMLEDAMQQVSQLQSQAGEEVRKVLTGEITDIHTAMIAVQKADVSFQMMMQVRNKIVSAYQEIMRMQV
jgi:flagellar hook-basal body complex protein FliE